MGREESLVTMTLSVISKAPDPWLAMLNIGFHALEL